MLRRVLLKLVPYFYNSSCPRPDSSTTHFVYLSREHYIIFFLEVFCDISHRLGGITPRLMATEDEEEEEARLP
jgi:hypothetical protein